MLETQSPLRPVFGWFGFVAGAAALLMAVTIFWAGPFAPQQATGVSLGELAADVGKAAMRSAVGLEQPAPELVARDLDDYLKVAVAVLGGIAVVLAAAGLVRHEPYRPAVAGVALGGAAILFQWFTWMVLVMAGALIIMALMESFSGFFEGLFGG